MKTRFRVPDFVEIKDLFKISCDCILVICASLFVGTGRNRLFIGPKESIMSVNY